VLQDGVIQFQQTIYAERVGTDLSHIVVHCLLVHAYLDGRLAVGDILSLKQQQLLDLTHTLSFSCHILASLVVVFDANVGKTRPKVNGYAPI